MRIAALVAAFAVPVTALAETRTFETAGAQVSAPVGLTVKVKSVTVGDDVVKVRLQASFDSNQTNSISMNGADNAYLAWGDGDQERLHLRQVADNKWMRILNGKTMEGDLVFPGSLPATASKVTLVFNPGNEISDVSTPGLVIPLELKK